MPQSLPFGCRDHQKSTHHGRSLLLPAQAAPRNTPVAELLLVKRCDVAGISRTELPSDVARDPPRSSRSELPSNGARDVAVISAG